MKRFSLFTILPILMATFSPLEAKKQCVYVDESPWLIPSVAALTVAGGIGFGYAAGRQKNRKATVRRNFFCTFKTSEVLATLAWIVPDLDSPVEAELYAPDQTLYAKATLDPMGIPPPIPSLGGVGKPSLVGNYTAVFTALNSPVTGNHFGGLIYDGEELFTSPVVPMMNEIGTQYKIEFFYPA